MAAPVILVEATPRRASDGASVTIRLAGAGASVPYHYGKQHWRAGLAGLPKTSASLDFDGEQLGGGGVAQSMELSWSPSTKAALAELADLYWADAPITVRVGPEGSEMPPILTTGLGLESAVNRGVLTIALADQAVDLKRPVLVDRFLGTGGIEGPVEFADSIKSRAWGRCFNVPGRQLDAANNIWVFGDPRHRWQSFDQVRDKGAAAAASTVSVLDAQETLEATFAALQAAKVIEGGGVFCPSIACVKWWTAPAGDLHADIRGEIAGGYVETAPEIVARIVAARSTIPFAPGAVAAAAAARPAPFGWRVDTDSATAAGEISQMLGDVSTSWLLIDGAIVFRHWDWTAPTRVARSFAVTRKSSVKPTASRKLGYRRNWAPMARGDLAAIVLVQDIVYEDGTPIADAIDKAGQTADWDQVTGGGKPADNATNGADPASPLGPNDTVAQVLARLAEARRNATEGLEQIAEANAAIEAARADVARTVADINSQLEAARGDLATASALATSTAGIARQTVQAALSGQLLEERRKARTDALTHLDGVTVGVRVQQETTQRIEGELATAMTFSLLGAKNSAGTAFLLNRDTVMVSADQSLAEKFVTIEAEFVSAAGITAAAISRLDTSIADEREARTTSITSLDSRFTNALGEAIGAVTADYREAVSNEAGARATAITAVQTDFTTKIGAATTAITDLARTTSNADQALGERITQVDAGFQTALGKTNATIVTLQQAQADEVGARTTAITNLTTSFNTALGNAVTAVTNDYRQAVSDEAGARATAITAVQTDFTTKIGAATTAITDLARTTSNADQALGERITQVDATFQTKLTEANASISTVQRAIADETGARTIALTNLGTSFDTKLGDAVSAVTRDYRQADSDEAGARATAITDLGASFTNALGNAILATTTNFNQAIADEAGARATQFGSVTARLDKVGGGVASVEQLFSVQAEALGNLSARAGLAVTAGSVVSGIYVTSADGSNGKISDITFAAMTINVSTAKLIFNNGSVMKVLGTGFGVGNEFIDWFGPSMPFDQCSRANGTVWQTVSGDAYFGGSLSAGALTNGANSSSVAADVVADTGGFGSDGGKITVVMSWTYTWTYQAYYAATASGRTQFDNAAANYGAVEDAGGWSGTRVEAGSPTLTLAREIGGASRIDVATASINPGVGSFEGSRPIPAAGDPGAATFTARWSGSLTYTDPDRIVTDRRFLATLARGFNVSSGLVSQRVTIITTEE
jgi:hypothetical protein